MRTNPPGEERDEGEGKKPRVVGEPGGLIGEEWWRIDKREDTDC